MQLAGEMAGLGVPETDIQSLPFGDGLNSYADQYAPATADDSTRYYSCASPKLNLGSSWDTKLDRRSVSYAGRP
jgi:hypothetical protein